jgi:hypothetical protein
MVSVTPISGAAAMLDGSFITSEAATATYQEYVAVAAHARLSLGMVFRVALTTAPTQDDGARNEVRDVKGNGTPGG